MHFDSIKIKPIHSDAMIPQRAHENDAGLDLFSIQDLILQPNIPTKVSTGIAFAIPQGWVGLICDRSSMGAKGIRTLGGVIDSGYRGEVLVLLINLKDESYRIQKGDKIAQILILPVHLGKPEAVDSLEDTTRSTRGFGSSGK